MSRSRQQAHHAHNLAHPAAHSDVPFPHGAGYAARLSPQARGLMCPSGPDALLKTQQNTTIQFKVRRRHHR
jgi:hypothetical protein